MPPLASYAKQHEYPNGVDDDRPTAMQIVQDEGLEGKWKGRVVLITGCSPGGLGPETARAMHATGADVYITGRDVERTQAVARDILSDGRPGRAEVVQLDLSSLKSVRNAAADFLERAGGQLNVLINNAGVMACPKGVTEDGFETHFGTNHLGHFLLFQLLKPALLASSTGAFNSRVVSLTSLGYRFGTISFDDFHFSKSEYDPWKAYGQSKLANIHFANELERRYGSSGLHALSVHPGYITTALQRHVDYEKLGFDSVEPRLLKSPQQGAATTVWAAVSKDWEGRGGRYLEDCSEAAPAAADDLYAPGYTEKAYDVPTEKRLWVESLKMAGLLDDNSVSKEEI